MLRGNTRLLPDGPAHPPPLAHGGWGVPPCTQWPDFGGEGCLCVPAEAPHGAGVVSRPEPTPRWSSALNQAGPGMYPQCKMHE